MIGRFFEIALPCATAPRNVVFRSEVRQIAWGATPALLRRTSLRTAAVVLVPMIGLWIALFVSSYTAPGPPPSTTFYRDGKLWSLVLLLFGISLCDKFVLDFFGLWVGLHSFNADVTAKRWDLLCLTSIYPETIIDARIALAQIQAWRVLIIAMSFRLGIVLLAMLTFFMPPIFFAEYRGAYDDLLQSFRDSPQLTLAAVTWIVSIIPCYLIEPYWRLFTFSAGGVEVASEMGSLPASLVGAAVKILLILVLQFLLVLMAIPLTIMIAAAVYVPPLVVPACILHAGVITFTVKAMYFAVAENMRWSAMNTIRNKLTIPSD